jgi:hypothetical protein
MKRCCSCGAAVLCFVFIVSVASRGQSVCGVPGYLTIPVATFNPDGSLLFGASFLPHQHLSYSEFQYDAFAVYTSLTFLSFIEVDLRVTRKLNYPSYQSHVADRVPTVRFRILKEKKRVPAVAVGFHDVLTSLDDGSAHHFGASYVVVTKNFTIAPAHLKIGATAGYGAGKLVWENSEFVGPFGGISLGSDKIPWMDLLADYDGNTVNAGARFALFHRLFLTAGTMNFDSFTGTFSYRFNLLR